MKEEDVCQPTYVYPVEVKMLLRSVFSKNICDYPDPCHDKVSSLLIVPLESSQSQMVVVTGFVTGHYLKYKITMLKVREKNKRNRSRFFEIRLESSFIQMIMIQNNRR